MQIKGFFRRKKKSNVNINSLIEEFVKIDGKITSLEEKFNKRIDELFTITRTRLDEIQTIMEQRLAEVDNLNTRMIEQMGALVEPIKVPQTPMPDIKND
jgi:predicted transcriptional regulator